MIVILENIQPKSVNVEAVDAKLRQRFPSLIGWGYSFVEDTLSLEFPDSEVETVIQNKITDALAQVKKDYANTKIRKALLKRVIEWVE